MGGAGGVIAPAALPAGAGGGAAAPMVARRIVAGGVLVGGIASMETGARSRLTTIRLKKGPKPSTSLKKLSGAVTARLLGESKPVVSVKDNLKAEDKTVKGNEGGSIHVSSVSKERNGSVTLRLTAELPGGMIRMVSNGGDRGILGDGIVGVNSQHDLTLVDSNGNRIPPASLRMGAGAKGVEYQFTFLAGQGTGEPAKLGLGESKSISVDLPVSLKGVPLP